MCHDEGTDVESAGKSERGYEFAEGPEFEVHGQQQQEDEQREQDEQQQQQQWFYPPQQAQSMEEVAKSSQNCFRVALTRTLCQAYHIKPNELLRDHLPEELEMSCSFFACGKYREPGGKFQDVRSFEVIVEPEVARGMASEKDVAKELRVAIKKVVKKVIEQNRRGAQGMALGNPRVRRVEFKQVEQMASDDRRMPEPRPEHFEERFTQGLPQDERRHTIDGCEFSPKYVNINNVSVKNTFLHYDDGPPPPPGNLGRIPSAP